MKRSPPPRRKTSLRRSSGRLLRGSSLKTVAPKRAKENRSNNHQKEMHRHMEGKPCQWCRRFPGSQVHHICGRQVGPMRHHRTNLLWVCVRCHEDIIPGVPPLQVLRVRKLLPGWDELIARQNYQNKNGRRDWL